MGATAQNSNQGKTGREIPKKQRGSGFLLTLTPSNLKEGEHTITANSVDVLRCSKTILATRALIFSS